MLLKNKQKQIQTQNKNTALHVGKRYTTPDIAEIPSDPLRVADDVHAVPPPPPPPLDGVRVRRRGKGGGKGCYSCDGTSYRWGPFLVSRVKSHGEWVGMGITCGLHTDSGDTESNVCQTALHFKTKNDVELDEAGATLRLKRWVHAGYEIRLSAADARSQHKGKHARAFVDGHDEDFLDGWVNIIR